ERRDRPAGDRTGPSVARGAGPALAIEVERRVVDSKAALASDGLGERGDGLFPEVFDGPAGGTDQVVMMPRLTPDIGRDVPGPLQPLGGAAADQRVERAEDGGAPNVGMLLAHPLVEFLRRGLFSGLPQHRGNREPLRGQPDTRLLKGRLRFCLNHNQMILPMDTSPRGSAGFFAILSLRRYGCCRGRPARLVQGNGPGGGARVAP